MSDPIGKLKREEIKAIFDAAGKVEVALGGLPYREAVDAMRELQEIRDIVGEELPGGWFGICPGCEEAKGEAEMVDCGDERLCEECADHLIAGARRAGMK